MEAEVVLLAVVADAGLSPARREEEQWQRQECDWGPVGDEDQTPVTFGFIRVANTGTLLEVEARITPVCCGNEIKKNMIVIGANGIWR